MTVWKRVSKQSCKEDTRSVVGSVIPILYLVRRDNSPSNQDLMSYSV